MIFKSITVAGGGSLGSQIAFQSAYCGINVTIWLYTKEVLENTQSKLEELKKEYLSEIELMKQKPNEYLKRYPGISPYDKFDEADCKKRVENALNNIRIVFDLAEAVKGAELLVESLPEQKETKLEFFKNVSPLLDNETIVATNSSTFLPSEFAKTLKTPEKFIALHFSTKIRQNNISEIMAHKDIDFKYFDMVVEYAEDIGMVALPARKEKAGYILNSMVVPLINCALDLCANEIADPQTIDKAWKIGTGSPKGPFEIIDTIGLKTTLDVAKKYESVPSLLSPVLKKMMYPYNYKGIIKLLEKYIADGKTGQASGEGFYKYK